MFLCGMSRKKTAKTGNADEKAEGQSKKRPLPLVQTGAFFKQLRKVTIDHMPIPGYPPPGGMPGIPPAPFSSGLSATMHWVVSMREATLAAFCRANRETF